MAITSGIATATIAEMLDGMRWEMTRGPGLRGSLNLGKEGAMMVAGRVAAGALPPGMHGLAGVDGVPALGTSGLAGVMAVLHLVAEMRMELISWTS